MSTSQSAYHPARFQSSRLDQMSHSKAKLIASSIFGYQRSSLSFSRKNFQSLASVFCLTDHRVDKIDFSTMESKQQGLLFIR